MLECFNNIRQTNEKIEECVILPKNELNDFYKQLDNIYKSNNVIL